MAVGQAAAATHANSVAIGAGSKTTAANQVALGSTGTSYNLAGLAGADTRIVTVDSAGTLGTTSLSALTGSVDALKLDIAELRTDMRRLENEVDGGIAVAMAMPDLGVPGAVGETAWGANVAVYGGEVAGALAISHRLNTRKPMALSVGASHGTRGKTGVKAGVAGVF